MKKNSCCIPPRSSFLFLLFTLVLTLFISCTGSAVFAQDFMVTETIDDLSIEGSLRYAITNAQDGDVISFDLAEYPAIITLNSQLTISKGITIQGPGAEDLSISGNNACRVFQINDLAQSLTISGISIVSGKHSFGGGIYNNSTSLTVTNCIFHSNTADTDGGGMFNNNCSPTVTNCTFLSNSAARGGGMRNYLSKSTVTNCTFSGNSASTGGGMYNDYSSPSVNNCTFSSNSATDDAGGMYNCSCSNPQVTNCTFYSNYATKGGGMYNEYSSPRFTNCTFSSNHATEGSGMYNYHDSSPRFTNCILWDEGDEIYNDSSSPVLSYCIVQSDDYGTGTTISGDVTSADPMLESLADNGGPTWTCALLAGSPAIDAGTDIGAPETDQRGISRPQGNGYDIGAYEVDVRSFTIVPYWTSGGTITPTSTTVFEGESVDFTVSPNINYHIDDIFVDWESISFETVNHIYTHSFDNISADHSILAIFAIHEYGLSADVTGNGSVVISPDLDSYPHGTEVELTALPGTGSDFTSWQGALSGDINPQILTMDEEKEVTALFDLKTFTITIDDCNHGDITGSSSVTWGSTPTYTITPDTGYSIKDIFLDGMSQGTGSSLTLDPVKDNHTLSATFQFNQGMVTGSGLEEFTVTPISSEQVENLAASVDLPGQITPESLDVVSEDQVLSLSMEGVVSGDVNPALVGRDADEEFLQGVSFDIVYSSDVVETGLLPLEINMEIPRDELGQNYCEIIDSQANEQGLASSFLDHVGIIKVISPDTYDLLETAWGMYPEEEAKGFFEISSDVENYYVGFDLLVADAKTDSADLAVQAAADSPDHYFFIFDGEEDGHFKDPIAAVKKPLAEESNSGGGGGGCNISALSATGLLLMAPVLFLLRGMK